MSIVVAAFYFIYHKLVNNNELSFYDFKENIIKNDAFSLKAIFFLILLSSFNWFFEILKWQNLVSTQEKTSFKQATNQTLGSLTASLITPNRIGEYGAKAMYFTKNLRKRIMLVNLISNLQQMGVTVVLGIIGLYFFVSKYNLDLNYYRLSKYTTIGFVLICLIIFILRKTKFIVKGFSIEKLKMFILNFQKTNLSIGFLLSFLRYAIFSFQFYFLLQCFHVEIDYFNSMIGITSMYLLVSIIPTIFIFDVVIKGSVAVYLFSFLGVNELIILCVITIMWLLNFVLPSIIGSFFVLRFKMPKTIINS
ncbi:lysylphosphatidylglycerol synthase domain-containing protein [Algibacter sp. L4_22]|uniref:lysylphosphatidylglycerol synthase domain-containing protein n=1 Tax=Algibacter sp. L4_22 TaxID=2942477 RepID=UPI00201B7EA0|nr:lysylphosphatidylglycerol synthase domain-containing protein [Algibacter sp. L4_22]MCL5126840.1 flippase-like domain-containing protein [Algibacter sp. L4_22]